MTTRKAGNLKSLHGTARADRGTRTVTGGRLTIAPRPPEHLSVPAAKQWRRLARQFTASGILTGADLVALELLAQALADEQEARATIAAEGLTIQAGSGGQKQHPAIRKADAARLLSVRLLTEFGATPAARQRVDAAPHVSDPGEAFLSNNAWTKFKKMQSGE